jgi:hypothetical protein
VWSKLDQACFVRVDFQAELPESGLQAVTTWSPPLSNARPACTGGNSSRCTGKSWRRRISSPWKW